MVDVFAQEIVDALERQGCPLCGVLEQSETWKMATFLREGSRAPEARLRFYVGGGFCRRHAWLFHELAVQADNGAVVAEIYGRLLYRDIEVLREVEAELARRGRRHISTTLRRAAACPACEWAKASLDRKASFLVEALDSNDVRTSYSASDGLCHPHFVFTLESALDGSPQVAQFLLRDWRARLEYLSHGLGEYRRKRDYRYAHEAKGDEQHSWTDVIRRYVGEP